MEAKYNEAIKAGIIGGVLLAVCAVLRLILSVIGMPVLSTVCGCLIWLLVIIIAAGTGALAVKYAEKLLAKLTDAIVVSAVAGAVAGLIYAVVQVVIGFVEPLLNIGAYSDVTSGLAGGVAGSAFLGMLTCLCAPVYLIIVIILAVIGGALYGALKLKLP